MAHNLKSGGGKASGSASIALPGRKLATSKTPRMMTPSEVELLRQDLRAALDLLRTPRSHPLLRGDPAFTELALMRSPVPWRVLMASPLLER